VLQARALRGVAAGQFFRRLRRQLRRFHAAVSENSPLGGLDNTYDT
jgi:hypothetical protein